jgi:predicted  nucleic acid-binding Zn-ribbon protein
MAARVTRAMTPPSPGHGDAAKAAHLLKAAKDLLLDSHIEDYVALVEDNTLLRKEKKTLEGDVDSRDRKIAKQLREIDVAKEQLDATNAQLDDLRTQCGALSRMLKEAQEGLRASHKEMASKEAGLVEEVATLQKNLDIERKELQKLKGFSVELIPVAKSHKEM